MKKKLLKLVIIAKFINARYINSNSQSITLTNWFLTRIYILFREILIWIMEILVILMLKKLNLYANTTRISTRT